MKLKLIVTIIFLVMLKLTFAGDFELGIKAFEAKHYSEAISHFQKVIKKEPKNANAYYNLGCAQYEMKNFGEAIWAFEKTMQFDPKNANSLSNLEVCHNKLELPPYEPIESGMMRNMTAFGSTSWSIVSIISALLIALSILLIKVTKSLNTKRLSVLFIFFGVIISLTSIYFASYTVSMQEQSKVGIIVEKRIQTFENFTTPKESGIFLNEGTRILNLNLAKPGFLTGNLSNGTEVTIRAKGIKQL